MANAFNKFGIKDTANLHIYKKSDLTKPYLYADYANVTTNEWASDTVYAKAKGVNAIGWDYNKNGTLKLSFEVLDKKLLAILAGQDFVEGATNVYAREVLTLNSSKEATMAGTAIDGTLSVFTLLADGTNGVELVVTTDYTIDEKKITVSKSGAKAGDKIAVYYQKAIATASTLTINANEFVKTNFLVVGDVMLKDTAGIEHPAQFTWLNCKPKSNFTITLDASNVATIEAEFDCFANSDNSGDMATFTFYDED